MKKQNLGAMNQQSSGLTAKLHLNVTKQWLLAVMRQVRFGVMVLGVVVGATVMLSQAALGERMWGDQGASLGRLPFNVEPASIKWGENSALIGYTSFDQDGCMRATLRIVGADGRLAPETPFYASREGDWAELNSVRLVDDGQGGVLVSWRYSNGPDKDKLFSQRLNGDLEKLWGEEGVSYFASGEIVLAGDGGFFVAESRAGQARNSYRLWITKLNGNGGLAEGWDENGREVVGVDRSGIYVYQEPTGGFWTKSYTLEPSDSLMVNHIYADGRSQFNNSYGVELPAENITLHQFIPDGQGSFFVIYAEGDEIAIGIQHYIHGVDPNWEFEDSWVETDNDEMASTSAAVSEDGRRVYLMIPYGEHYNNRELTSRLYCFESEVGPVSPVWENPIEFAGTVSKIVAVNGNDGVVVSSDHFSVAEGDSERRFDYHSMQLVNGNGERLWGEGGVRIDGERIVGRNDGGFITLDMDYYRGVAKSINAEGELGWEGEGTTLYAFGGLQFLLFCQSVGGNRARLIGLSEEGLGAIYLGADGATTNVGMESLFLENGNYPQTICASGSKLGMLLRWPSQVSTSIAILDENERLHPENPIPISNLIGEGRSPNLTADGNDGFYLTYRRPGGRDESFMALRLNAECEAVGEPLWPWNIATGKLDILADADGGGVAYGVTSQGEVLVQKFDRDNRLAWEAPHHLVPAAGVNDKTILVKDSRGSLIRVCASNDRNFGPDNAYIKKYDSEGNDSWGRTLAAFDSGVWQPAAGASYRVMSLVGLRSDGKVWVVGSRKNADNDNYRIQLQLVSEDGALMLGAEGLRIPDGANAVLPEILVDDSDGVWISWSAAGEVNSWARVLHLDREGNVVNVEGDEDRLGTALALNLPDVGIYSHMEGMWKHGDGSVGVAYSHNINCFYNGAQRLNDEPEAVNHGRPPQPDELWLSAAYPSPTNAAVSFAYRTAGAGKIKLELIDLNGRRVGTIYSGVQFAGEHRESLDLRGVGSGEYFVRLESGGMVRTARVVVVK